MDLLCSMLGVACDSSPGDGVAPRPLAPCGWSLSPDRAHEHVGASATSPGSSLVPVGECSRRHIVASSREDSC